MHAKAKQGTNQNQGSAGTQAGLDLICTAVLRTPRKGADHGHRKTIPIPSVSARGVANVRSVRSVLPFAANAATSAMAPRRCSANAERAASNGRNEGNCQGQSKPRSLTQKLTRPERPKSGLSRLRICRSCHRQSWPTSRGCTKALRQRSSRNTKRANCTVATSNFTISATIGTIGDARIGCSSALLWLSPADQLPAQLYYGTRIAYRQSVAGFSLLRSQCTNRSVRLDSTRTGAP